MASKLEVFTELLDAWRSDQSTIIGEWFYQFARDEANADNVMLDWRRRFNEAESVSIDRGVCPATGKARFTHDEALDKVRAAKLRGHALVEYRCPEAACGGWFHTAHATDHDGHGGGVQRVKRRKPTRRITRARKL